MCQYVKISTRIQETERCLHCFKGQIINRNGSNGKHEARSPSKVETDELNHESSQDQELLPENG